MSVAFTEQWCVQYKVYSFSQELPYLVHSSIATAWETLLVDGAHVLPAFCCRWRRERGGPLLLCRVLLPARTDRKILLQGAGILLRVGPPWAGCPDTIGRGSTEPRGRVVCASPSHAVTNSCFGPRTFWVYIGPSCLWHRKHFECSFHRLKIRLKVLAEIFICLNRTNLFLRVTFCWKSFQIKQIHVCCLYCNISIKPCLWTDRLWCCTSCR